METPQFAIPVQQMIAAVLHSARYILSEIEQGAVPTFEVKKDHTLVLNLDMKSHEILLRELAGTIPLVSEEDESTHRLIGVAENYFAVDPLDGTTSCKRFLTQTDTQVGFGPMVGFIEKGRLQGSVFYHVPNQTLFVAQRGIGSFKASASRQVLKEVSDDGALRFEKLIVADSVPLSEAGVLFFVGLGGELRVIQELKKRNLVENVYRFGGFANDCSRLAQGFEQIQIQFAVKAWDLPAALFQELAGLSVMMDPFHTLTELKDWKVETANPLLACPPSYMKQLLEISRAIS